MGRELCARPLNFLLFFFFLLPTERCMYCVLYLATITIYNGAPRIDSCAPM